MEFNQRNNKNGVIIPNLSVQCQFLTLYIGNWCNVQGTGFGIRPSANTGDPLVDAFVWVKISD
jgi:hypothetical protein